MMGNNDFYKYIIRKKDTFEISNGKEKFGTYNNLADALYERDRLVAVNWDWDKSMELPETTNKYLHMELPPFVKQSSFITKDKECWVVRNKGREQTYRGTYYSLEEAMEKAQEYDATVSHKKEAYRVQKVIDGRTRYFGRFRTYEEAERKVKELKDGEWNVNITQ